MRGYYTHIPLSETQSVGLVRETEQYVFVRDVVGLLTRRMVMTKGLRHNFRLFGNACSTFGLVNKKYETSDDGCVRFLSQ